MSVRIEEVTTVARLREVAPAWDELWERAPGATPFTSPAWLLPWCDHLLDGAPLALLAWRDGALAAVMPSFVYEASGVRVLGLLGGAVSDYQDVVAADREVVGDVLDHLARHLARSRRRFDALAFEALPPGSLLLAGTSPALRASVTRQEVCPVLALPARADDLAAVSSPRLLADVRYQRRRLTREGGWEIVGVRRETLGAFLCDLFRLHHARWSARGEDGVLRGDAIAAFHRDAARAMLERGLLRSYALRAAGATLGAFHGFAAHGRTYAYLPAMDPAAARRSPGSLLFAHAIERAIEERCSELDFLRGAEPYKYRWGARDRFSSRLVTPPASAAVADVRPPPRELRPATS